MSFFIGLFLVFFLVANNTEDLFICGKCHTNFNDLNVFLTHRSSCNIQQLTNLYPLPNSPSTGLLERELDAIIQDVSLNIPSTTSTVPTSGNLYYEESPTTNEFDLLFSQPVEQDPVLNETINTNIYNRADEYSIENGIAQMSLLECPVCDEQFDAPTILENHVFEHSTWVDECENHNLKNGLIGDDSSSSYIDLFDDSPTTPLECEQCTFTFTSNTSLNIHKKMGIIIFV